MAASRSAIIAEETPGQRPRAHSGALQGNRKGDWLQRAPARRTPTLRAAPSASGNEQRAIECPVSVSSNAASASSSSGTTADTASKAPQGASRAVLAVRRKHSTIAAGVRPGVSSPNPLPSSGRAPPTCEPPGALVGSTRTNPVAICLARIWARRHPFDASGTSHRRTAMRAIGCEGTNRCA